MSKPQVTDAQIPSKVLLQSILAEHKDDLAKTWIAMVHGSYPLETIGFLRTRKDQFANPVGHRTDQAAKAIINLLLDQRLDQAALESAVEELIRVRAIQDFSPEIALGVFFGIKKLIRDILQKSGRLEVCFPAILELEEHVDALCLLAFGIYARCRERLHQLKVEEFKRSHSQILRLAMRKANLLEEADHKNP